MPRWFRSVEALDHDLPLSSGLIRELGLRGINCGSGRLLERGWLNTDQARIQERDGREAAHGRLTRVDESIYYLRHDSTTPYPVEDETFDWAFSEHFIEHLPPEDAIAWLREVRRVLRPGGLVRVTTPSLARYARAYLDESDPFYAVNREALSNLRVFRDREVPDRRGWMLNNIFYNWGHRWIYDFGELKHALVTAGFEGETVVERGFHEGEVAEVAALDGEGRSHESIYVEARRG
jgi:predicted SAM-dependent methyltransferase